MEIFNKIVLDIFKVPLPDIKDSLTAKDIPDWDSMNFLLFIAEIEKQFNVSFNINEILNVSTLGEIKKMLRAKNVNI